MITPWFTKQIQHKDPIVKIPLQFYFEPVEIISKQLTKLNCTSIYRIFYLGPRWENSQALHKVYSKKHGYKYDDKRINNNSTFFSESMCNNQFYKNQVYYRAFEGMNPTIDRDKQLKFDSKFQSGNLDCVVKIDQNQYDLFLRVDSNTKGHLFWFYFEISNAKPGSQIKLNICNMTKSIQLYQKGFKPYSSTLSPNGQFQSWTQNNCKNVTIKKKQLRYRFVYQKIKVRPLHQLSFIYRFKDQHPVRFAYCIPYTYTKMIQQINQYENKDIKTGVIGRTLTGVDIPVIQIGKNDEEDIDKPVIFVIGRAHPGQSNGSHTLSGFIQHVCQSPEATYLRNKAIFVIVPMLNPDGVIIGNSRTGASGKDLNRQFRSKNKYLFSEVDAVKRLVYKILQTHDIQMFLDFHGHSRKKNMFFFGPNYNLTQPQYYKARMMPKYLSQITPLFRYYSCLYSIPPSKVCTARAVMFNQMGIPFVYTVQTSVGQYYDYEQHHNKPFNQKKFMELGSNLSRAIQMYLESIQQYEQFLNNRKQQIQPVQSPLKRKNISRGLQDRNNQKINSNDLKSNTQTSYSKSQKKKLIMKDIKMLKVLEQIKILEENKPNRKKEEVISDASSDSQDDKDNLQKNKMLQFQGMVTQCIQTQNLKQQRIRQISQPKKYKKQIQFTPKLSKRPKKKLDIQNNLKDLLKNLQKNQTKFISQHRQTKSLEPAAYKSQPKTLIITRQQAPKNMNILDQQQLLVSEALIYKIRQQKRPSVNKINMLNLKMFNFSEMIQEPLQRNIMTCSQRKRDRYTKNMNNLPNLEQKTSTLIVNKQQQNKGFSSKYHKMNIEPIIIDEQQIQQNRFSTKSQKQKGIFPAPFYRIKYQNHQKKKQRIFQQKQVMLMRADEQFNHTKKIQYEKKSKKKGINFLNIKRALND